MAKLTLALFLLALPSLALASTPPLSAGVSASVLLEDGMSPSGGELSGFFSLLGLGLGVGLGIESVGDERVERTYSGAYVALVTQWRPLESFTGRFGDTHRWLSPYLHLGVQLGGGEQTEADGVHEALFRATVFTGLGLELTPWPAAELALLAQYRFMPWQTPRLGEHLALFGLEWRRSGPSER